MRSGGNRGAAEAATVLFVLIAWLGFVSPGPLSGAQSPGWWLLKLVAVAAAAWSFYGLAVRQAVAWGQLVRGAFDPYRNDVLKTLGFTQQPRTLKEELTADVTARSRQRYTPRRSPVGSILLISTTP